MGLPPDFSSSRSLLGLGNYCDSHLPLIMEFPRFPLYEKGLMMPRGTCKMLCSLNPALVLPLSTHHCSWQQTQACCKGVSVLTPWDSICFAFLPVASQIQPTLQEYSFELWPHTLEVKPFISCINLSCNGYLCPILQ